MVHVLSCQLVCLMYSTTSSLSHRVGNFTILVTVTSNLSDSAAIGEAVLSSFSSLIPATAQVVVMDVERFGELLVMTIARLDLRPDLYTQCAFNPD